MQHLLFQKLSMQRLPLIRAHVFLEGRICDLVKSMDSKEKEYRTLKNAWEILVNKSCRTTFTWLNQFWLFGFQTAKSWGRGPRDWTAAELGFSQYRESASSIPSTPGMNMGSPRLLGHSDRQAKVGKGPSQLCRWSIHKSVHPYSNHLKLSDSYTTLPTYLFII